MTGERGSEKAVVVHVPDHLPPLSPRACRTLLGILVELTTVEILDGPPEGVNHDC